MSTATPTSNGLDTSAVAASGTPFVDALITEQLKWGGAVGTGITISYSIPNGTATWAGAGVGQYGNAGEYEPGGWSGLSSGQAAYFRQALQTWADVANITFQEVAESPTVVGDIRVAFSSVVTSAAWAYYPDTFSPCAGDIWLSPTASGDQDFQPGNYGFTTLVHEIGHALGLSHPNDNPGDPTYSAQTTVMSYNDWPNDLYRSVTGSAATGYSFAYIYVNEVGPSINDIAAIQYLYGANTSYHAGDDTYSFDTEIPFFRTLWDGGGNDTISVANFADACILDLRAGSFCSIAVSSDPLPPGYSGGSTPTYYGQNNLGIAYACIIENAIGGAGADTLIGNAAGNLLTGGAGNDSADGGGGLDTAVFSASRASYTITRNLASITVAGPDGTDILTGIERLRFADGDVVVKASAIDFDGDGSSDLLWRNTATGVNSIWKGASSGSAQSVKTFADQNWQVAGTGDFDGDGKYDILWRNFNTGGNIIWKSANYLTAQAVAAFTNLDWKVAGVGDFNGDGKSDILWRNGATATNKIWLGANAATIQNVAKTANQDWQVAGIGDFDGDGKSDILWRNGASGANLIWQGANSATAVKLTAQTDLNWKVAGIGDFDGDGKSDILWRHAGTGGNKIWRSASSATVQAVATAGLAWQVMGTGDYDGDGKSDILWRNTTTTAGNIWKGASSATTQAVSAQSLDYAAIDGVSNGDLLLGGAGNNRLIGTLASDSLSGGAGSDILHGGGGGKDTMVGGAGHDSFVIDRVAQLTAAITDFVAGEDKIALGQAAYGGLFTAGSLKTGIFASGSSDAFATASQRLQYNAATGALWYDADGVDGAAAVQIGTLGTPTARPDLTAANFMLTVA